MLFVHSRHVEELVLKMTTMFKVILITETRQVGKTTLIKHLFGETYDCVSRDDVNAFGIAKPDPKLFFLNHLGKIIIDEVQYAPELFGEIKRRVYASETLGAMILTGAQTYALMKFWEIVHRGSMPEIYI